MSQSGGEPVARRMGVRRRQIRLDDVVEVGPAEQVGDVRPGCGRRRSADSPPVLGTRQSLRDVDREERETSTTAE
jgi:hypothetical protein